MEVFEQIGAAIDARWREQGWAGNELPAIATDVLLEFEPHRRITVADVIAWATTTEPLPKQRNLHLRFGQPPVSVYDSERFYIQVLFWVDGATTIHKHSFAGAFSVLAGSSIHSRV